jgi:dolichyl-phosphate beta-glucosyltransferase
MSVVVPAFNEDQRLGGMLEEAVEYLQRMYTAAKPPALRYSSKPANGQTSSAKSRRLDPTGWEILIVSDGSTDDTVVTALTFAVNHQIKLSTPVPIPGPRSPHPDHISRIPPGAIRVVSLEENRGKGGATVHGLRHVRGQYALFVDADGATRFSDLSTLLSKCQSVEDADGRGIAIGSRAHLVGSEAVVSRSKLRNFLMHSFHLFLRLMTPTRTASIKDTQCGFKLFSRPALKYVVPYMNSQRWIFDVEMLMLAEFADIPVVEVPVAWKEVNGSKLNVVWDSIGMAWGLSVLRMAYLFGVYRRK